jgi:iron complex outermembrane recepter protein
MLKNCLLAGAAVADASVGAQSPVDLNIGYRFGGDSFAGGLEAQLNVTKLFDERYVSTIGSNGFVNSDPDGLNQTCLLQRRTRSSSA